MNIPRIGKRERERERERVKLIAPGTGVGKREDKNVKIVNLKSLSLLLHCFSFSLSLSLLCPFPCSPSLLHGRSEDYLTSDTQIKDIRQFDAMYQGNTSSPWGDGSHQKQHCLTLSTLSKKVSSLFLSPSLSLSLSFSLKSLIFFTVVWNGFWKLI